MGHIFLYLMLLVCVMQAVQLATIDRVNHQAAAAADVQGTHQEEYAIVGRQKSMRYRRQDTTTESPEIEARKKDKDKDKDKDKKKKGGASTNCPGFVIPIGLVVLIGRYFGVRG
ncbi:hypothetical protein WDU94_005771 [Cyamophila willieti]